MENKTDIECSASENKKSQIKKRTIIFDIFSDYCSSTSLHGIGYVGAENKKFAEKLWWLIVFILSLISCSYLITRTYIKWTNDPVILSFEKEQIPIWEIPFPAITVCPVNKMKPSAYNYTEVFRNRDNLTEEEYKEFWDMSLICNLEQYHYEFNCTLNTTDEDAILNMILNSESLGRILFEAKWQNKENYKVFADQITEEGVCFTFNSFSQGDMFTDEVNDTITHIFHNIKNTGWSKEDGYSGKMKNTDYPRRTAKDGISSGLSFTLSNFRSNNDYVCGMPVTGYKIILHNPAEIPKAAQQYFLIPANRKANIIIKPEVTRTPKYLQSLPAHTRKCYFSLEKSLRFFKVYTQTNCHMECDANIILQYCGCVPFYLPHATNTTICGYGSNDCIKEVKSVIQELEMTENEVHMSRKNKKRIESTLKIFKKCDCMPSCNSLIYSAEISQSEYHFMKTLLASGLYEKDIPLETQEELRNGEMELTQVDIFFKDSQFYALHRSEIYGRVDFLASVGGLLGLFMGFSLLSLVEMIYFLTIRIWFKCLEVRKTKTNE